MIRLSEISKEVDRQSGRTTAILSDLLTKVIMEGSGRYLVVTHSGQHARDMATRFTITLNPSIITARSSNEIKVQDIEIKFIGMSQLQDCVTGACFDDVYFDTPEMSLFSDVINESAILYTLKRKP
jgi:hypothetical protein